MTFLSSTKKCTSCGEEKDSSEYYWARGYILHKCKACVRAQVTKHRQDNIEQARTKDKLRQRRGSYEDVKEYRLFYPSRAQAHTAVQQAVRDGKLKPLPCLICGVKAEAHHPDYSLPLSVVWLCSIHHKQLHNEYRGYKRVPF